MALHLITGGGGYLGSYLAHRLSQEGHQVRAMDLKQYLPLPPGCEFIQSDIRNRSMVRKACKEVDTVHHIAFVQSMSRLPERVQKSVAIDGTTTLLEEAQKAWVRRFVYTSTIEIYGTCPPFPCPEEAPKDPVGLYGNLKWEGEQLAFSLGRQLGLEVTALRMPTICGAGFYNHRPLLALMERVCQGGILAYGGKGNIRGDFVHIEDVISAYLLVSQKKEAVGEAFNISAPSATHKEILESLRDALKSSSKIISIPFFLIRWMLPLGRLIKVTDLPAEQDGYLLHHNCYSTEKAARLLGFKPRYTTVEAARDLALGYLQKRAEVLLRSQNY